MSSELIALVLDFVVLVFLAATIFYAIRLSKGLSDFKAHRREFDGVITSLLSSIDQAERSIANLRQVGAQEAAELERLIKQSKAMSEELKIINEAGESMAKRLEKLAEKNREVAQRSNPLIDKLNKQKKIHSKIVSRPQKDYKDTLKTVDKEAATKPPPSFMIQDREFMDLGSLEDHLDSSVSNDAWEEADDDLPEELQSQAEKELFAALRNNKGSNKRKGFLRGGS